MPATPSTYRVEIAVPARVVVLVSGSGTLLQALMDATGEPDYPARVVAVGADRSGIEGLARAGRHGVPTFVVRTADHPDRPSWDDALAKAVAAHRPDLVVSAGFMKVLGPGFLTGIGCPMINTHPALLPAFPGIHGVADALAYGVKVTGATVHLVDAGVDTGPVLAQAPVPVLDGDTADVLHERIKIEERRLLVGTVAALARHGRHRDRTRGEDPVNSVESQDRRPVRRALVSVYDKAGLDELAVGLHAAGVEIVSTGSTAQRIADAGVPVTAVEQLTGFPECLDGRVKTLHPSVHAGLLADTRRPEHIAQLDELGHRRRSTCWCPTSTRSPPRSPPARRPPSASSRSTSAARRWCGRRRRTTTAWPSSSSRRGTGGCSSRSGSAASGSPTAAASPPTRSGTPPPTTSPWRRGWAACWRPRPDGGPVPVLGRRHAGTARATLRYGENPHQAAALYVGGAQAGGGLASAEQLHGKEMSYNNYVDADTAWRAAHDHDDPCVAIVKHANPCGIAVAGDIAQAHRKAHATDPASAFGGVIAANREVTVEMAEQVAEVFTEVVLAPSYAAGALEVARPEEERAGAACCPAPSSAAVPSCARSAAGCCCSCATPSTPPVTTPPPGSWPPATRCPAEVLADLGFAWRACRSVKSNAILLASGGAAVGVGMGQVNRVDAARLAVARAGDRARGSVAASDAFFPFPDGLEVLLDAGVVAVVQPGGSVRDDVVTAAAAAAGVPLYLTGTRHFAH